MQNEILTHPPFWKTWVLQICNKFVILAKQIQIEQIHFQFEIPGYAPPFRGDRRVCFYGLQ